MCWPRCDEEAGKGSSQSVVCPALFCIWPIRHSHVLALTSYFCCMRSSNRCCSRFFLSIYCPVCPSIPQASRRSPHHALFASLLIRSTGARLVMRHSECLWASPRTSGPDRSVSAAARLPASSSIRVGLSMIVSLFLADLFRSHSTLRTERGQRAFQIAQARRRGPGAGSPTIRCIHRAAPLSGPA